MARNKRIANPSVVVNNIPIAIVANSCTFTEGLGEQTVEPQSAGGQLTESVYAEDVKSKLSTVKFSLATTDSNIAMARSWKVNGNSNVIVITGDSLSRTFTSAGLTTDYEVALGTDGALELEWKADPAI